MIIFVIDIMDIYSASIFAFKAARPDERQLFGLPGGVFNDWELKTNLEYFFAAGDQLFAADCVGHAAATGHYAGRHAADYALKASETVVNMRQVTDEKKSCFFPCKSKPRWVDFFLLPY